MQEEDLYQAMEPMVSHGITAALKMASTKGFIEDSKGERQPGEVMRVSTDAQRDK